MLNSRAATSIHQYSVVKERIVYFQTHNPTETRVSCQALHSPSDPPTGRPKRPDLPVGKPSNTPSQKPSSFLTLPPNAGNFTMLHQGTHTRMATHPESSARPASSAR